MFLRAIHVLRFRSSRVLKFKLRVGRVQHYELIMTFASHLQGSLGVFTVLPYEDRFDAGIRLAKFLSSYDIDKGAVVLGLVKYVVKNR